MFAPHIYDFAKIGGRMRKIRKSKKISQSQAAEAVGVAQYQTVAAWEHGRASPSLDTMLKLCNLYGCQLGYLLGDYVAETWDESQIVDATSLTPEAVANLVKLSPAQLCLLDDLLQHPNDLERIASRYAVLRYAHNVITPSVRQHAADLGGKDILLNATIDGIKMPTVPVQDTEDYARFEFLRAVTNFVEREG